MNIFKTEIISRRVFILIVIIAIIIGTGVYYLYDKKQDRLDKDFEKSREGIEQMINNINKK